MGAITLSAGPPRWSDAGIEALYDAHVNPSRLRALRSAFGQPVVMGERAGSRFRDVLSGRWLWDCHVNGGTFNLGHRNPRARAALSAALDHLDIGNQWLPSAIRAKLAARLVASTGGVLNGVVFSPSGSEATDVALKFARAGTGRQEIVSIVGGYHGHTGLALATGAPSARERFQHHLPGFTQVPYNDLAAVRAAVSRATAAVIVEAIPATLGMPMPAPGYLEGLQTACRRHGALLILDEVQTGLGRTGTMWSYQQDGIEPDMVLVGKGLSGGVYPMAATLMREELLDPLRRESFAHVTTFGGAELGCAVALAVLDLIEAPGFLDRVREVGPRFGDALSGLACQVRRRGMFMGLAWPQPDGGVTAARRLLRAGVWAVFAGNDRSVMQFLPPLLLTDEEVEQIVGCVTAALGPSRAHRRLAGRQGPTAEDEG